MMSAPLQNTCKTWSKLDFLVCLCVFWGGWIFLLCFDLVLLLMLLIYRCQQQYVCFWHLPDVGMMLSMCGHIEHHHQWIQHQVILFEFPFIGDRKICPEQIFGLSFSYLFCRRWTSHEHPRSRVRNSEQKMQSMLFIRRFGNWK